MACGVQMKNPSVSQGTSSLGHRRFVVAALSSLTSFYLSACEKSGPSAVPEAPRQPAQTGGEEKPVPARPLPARHEAQGPPQDLFLRGRSVKFESSSDLLKAWPEKFSRSALESQKIHHSAWDSSSDLWLAVDHHAPRPARAPYFVITDLVTEDVELAPGSHWLTVFEWGEAGQGRLQSLPFFVDVPPGPMPRSLGCLLVTPLLTKNGREASAEIRFLSVPLAQGLDRVEYRAVAAGLLSQGEAPPGTEMVLKGPPAGDVELSVRCFSGSEQVASDEQTVTVNPEAKDAEQPE